MSATNERVVRAWFATMLEPGGVERTRALWRNPPPPPEPQAAPGPTPVPAGGATHAGDAAPAPHAALGIEDLLGLEEAEGATLAAFVAATRARVFTLLDLLSDDADVAARWRTEAVLPADPAAGRPDDVQVAFEGSTWFRLRFGLIEDVWTLWEPNDVRAQLGLPTANRSPG